MTSEAAESPYIPALDGLRFIAAYIVFVSHFSNETNIFNLLLGAGAGQIGVMLFFMLSGYLISCLYLTTPISSQRAKRYLRNRAARVLPLYYLIIFMSFALTAIGLPGALYNIDSSSLADHALLLRGTSVLWTIPVEVQYYVLFVALWFLRTLSGLTAAASVVAIIVVVLQFYPQIREIDWQLLSFVHFFAGGSLASMVAPKIKGIVGRSRHGQVSADLSFVAALFALPLFFPQVTKQLLGIEVAFAGWGSAYTFMICLTLLMASATSPLASRTLGSRLFIAGGKISYSIYLLHLPIFILLRPVMDTHGTLIYFLACNMTTFAICTLTYFAIEKPARELIRAENASDNAELRQPGSAG